MTVADDAVAKALGSWRVDDRPPTLREFSRRIIIPGGPMRGHYYDPDSCPIQSWFIDQIDAGCWERFYLCSPPQIGGKSLVGIQLPTLRAAIACGLPVGYGLPTEQDLNKAWAEKLRPTIERAGFGEHLPDTGPSSRRGRGPTVTFQDPESGRNLGGIVFMAGRAYGSTVAVALIDEVDQYRSRTTGEPNWQLIEDVFHRADSYGSQAIRGAMGTVEHDDQSIILELVYSQGTGTRPWMRCPLCGARQLLEWSQVTYDDADEITAKESARMACQHCAELWDEPTRQDGIQSPLFVHRGQSVQGEEIVGNAPRTRSLGLLWTALDSTLADLGELAVEHYRAKKAIEPDEPDRLPNHDLMRKFVRYRQCQTYHGDRQDENEDIAWVDHRTLMQRSEQHGWAPISKLKGEKGEREGWSRYISTRLPEEIMGFVRAIDVQHNRVYWSMLGVDDRFRTWDCFWGYEHAFPDKTPMAIPPELHLLLDRTAAVLDDLTNGLPVFRSLVDIGDRETWILPWLVKRNKWRAVRGVEDNKSTRRRFDGADVFFNRRYKPGIGIFEVMTDVWRRKVHEAFCQPPDETGAAILPRGLSSGHPYIQHLCRYRWQRDMRSGDLVWKKGSGIRDDHLDTRVYATAVNFLRLQRPSKPRRRPRKSGVVGHVG